MVCRKNGVVTGGLRCRSVWENIFWSVDIGKRSAFWISVVGTVKNFGPHFESRGLSVRMNFISIFQGRKVSGKNVIGW